MKQSFAFTIFIIALQFIYHTQGQGMFPNLISDIKSV